MAKYKVRQEVLKNAFEFDCHCELCRQENIESDDEIYNEFDKLKNEAKDIKVESGKHMKYPDSYLRLCYLYKKMYKLARERKTSKTFIVYKLLTFGFEAAVTGYLQSKEQKQFKNKDIFRKECDIFCDAGLSISESVLPNTDIQKWKQRKENLDLSIEREDMKTEERQR